MLRLPAVARSRRSAPNSTTLRSAPTDDLKTIRPRDLGVRDLQTAPGGADLVRRIVRSLVRTCGTRSPESPPVGSATLWQPTPSALPVTRRRQSTINFLPLLVLPRDYQLLHAPLCHVRASHLNRRRWKMIPFPVASPPRNCSLPLFPQSRRSRSTRASISYEKVHGIVRRKQLRNGYKVAARRTHGCGADPRRDEGVQQPTLSHARKRDSRRWRRRKKKWCVARSWHARKRQNKAAKRRSGPGA